MTPWSPRRPVRPFPAVAEEHPVPADAAPAVRGFEGRPLARPHEDVEDQGAAFDVGTLVSRRGALGVLGVGAGALVLAACGTVPTASSSGTAGTAAGTTAAGAVDGSGAATAEVLKEMTGETAGPYPGDGSNGPDVLEASGIVRSDLRTGIDSDTAVEGVPMTLTLRVVDMADGNAPMVGAAVYVWHCDPQGRYSMYSDGVTGETWLRGVQVTGDDGTVTFTSVVPGCYAGRWPHVHFEVFSSVEDITDAGNAILTSQIAIPGEQADRVYALDAYAGSAENAARITLETDNVFSDGWEQQLPTVAGSVENGFRLAIDVPIDTTTAPEAGAAPGGGGGAPVGPPPAGGPTG